jgi:phage head maturation protease
VSDKAVNFLIEESTVKVFGHAAVLGERDVSYGDLGYTEEITREAFEQAVAESSARLLYNFDSAPIDDDLYLKVDERGLFVYAVLNQQAQQLRDLAMCAAENGENLPMEFGFGFCVREQNWDYNYSHRIITKLELISISIVSAP